MVMIRDILMYMVRQCALYYCVCFTALFAGQYDMENKQLCGQPHLGAFLISTMRSNYNNILPMNDSFYMYLYSHSEMQ